MERLICFVKWLDGVVFEANSTRRLRWIIGFASIFLMAQPVDAASLEWDANVETNLAGYKIYFGATSGAYSQSIDVGNVTIWPIPAEWPDGYFAATAYDAEGLESGFSNEVLFTTGQLIPQPATGLVVMWGKKQIANTFWITGGLPAGDIGTPHSGGSTFYITGGLPGYDQGGP